MRELLQQLKKEWPPLPKKKQENQTNCHILTRKAVVNCASALSIQFTEIQYRPCDMGRTEDEIF